MTSPTKRKRRSRQQIDAIKDAMYRIVEQDRPMTVRQVFYQLVWKAVIEKLESEYKGTVCRLLVEMREAGALPFDWIADNTRWVRAPTTYSSVESALLNTARTYRRSLMDTLPVNMTIWCEKDALAGVLMEETYTWDVPLMVVRGFSSISYLHYIAERAQATRKPSFVYHFGDWDPSGVGISEDVEKKLRRYAPDVPLHFERIAVTPEQIEELRLPTRPTKKTDSRSKNFEGESVDLDAIPPKVLRELVRGCITRHVGEHQLRVLRQAEAAERAQLQEFARSWAGLLD